MSAEAYEGRDVLTGRPVRVSVRAGTVQDVELLDTAADLPWLSHALVDLQVNGFGGIDVNSVDLTVDDVSAMVRELARHGTGAWVPTVITQDHEHIARILRVLADAVAQDPVVAGAIRAAHIEGPFISPHDGPRGAHAVEHVRDIAVDEVRRWHEIFPIGYVTVSPHWDDAPRKVAALRRLGVHVAIGHTHATAEQVAGASVAGATLSTHLGNGVRSEIARHPNLLWEQIADPTLDAGLIADGHHLPATVVETVVRAKGVDHCFLVSDSVALAGSPPGRYTTPVGGEVVLSADRRLALASDQRLLAGSAVSLADCVRFALAGTRLSRSEVFAMATRVPGRLFAELGGGDVIGTITPGSMASLVLWDRDFQALQVVTGSGARTR
ncbi:amidohydrolase family protein [Georgenia sp. 311]|uniref:N-acetylglucosamine-6-phosphate deacetylase n=1 Tax=Georgenia sp. 311 TaxID=2585134 RepID=UPI001111B5B2|nr:amidohydrolase family protein [Georgenia sp. 311]TNC18492.1 amidohydrolase family protein [Georgenia sp. 311]